MLRLAQRCIRPQIRPDTIKSFSTVRPNRSNLLASTFVRPPRTARFRRIYATDAKPAQSVKPPSTGPAVDDAKLPVSQRLKILFKKYRWPALTVYLGLGALDFAIAFIGVRAIGTERVARYEKIILKKIEDTVGWKRQGTPSQHLSNLDKPSIWTEIALAYTIHKTLFALIRVPLTVAITPSLVKWYHRKGYAAVLAQLPAVGRFFQNNATVAAVRK
jgi:N-terminal acetyltransferase 2